MTDLVELSDQEVNSKIADALRQIEAEDASAAANPGILGPARQLAQGATFSFGDNLVAGLDTLVEGAARSIRAPFSEEENLPTHTELLDHYNRVLAEERGGINAYQKAYPGRSLALQAAGGLAQVAGAAPKTLGQAALTGAKFGALEGAGSADERPLTGALYGAGAGTLLGPLFKAGASGLGSIFKSEPAQRLAESIFGGSAASQTGAIGNVGRRALKTPDAGEAYIMREMRNVPAEAIPEARALMSQAVEQGSPLYLPEAVKDAQLTDAAAIVANYPGGQSVAQKALEARSEGASKRISGLLEDISPEVSASQAGGELMSSAENLVGGYKKARSAETKPLYAPIENERIADELVLPLLDDPVIMDAMKKVQVNPAYQKELAGADPMSFKSLSLAKQHLDDTVQTLTGKEGKANEARIVRGSRDKLVDTLETLPGFEQANETYRLMSGPVNWLEGGKSERGLLESIIGKDRIKAHEAPAELLNMTAGQINQLKSVMKPEGVTAMKKSARSLLEDVMSKADDSRQEALLLLKNDATRDKFRAILGDAEFDSIYKKLGIEKLIAKGKTAYNRGSTTNRNLRGDANLEGVAAEVASVAESATSPTKFMKKFANYFLDRTPSEETAKGAAEIFFDSERGAQFLDDFGDYIVRAMGRRATVDKATGGLAEFGTKRSGQALDPFLPKDRK